MTGLVNYRLVWPRELKNEQVISALRAFATSVATPVVIEADGIKGRVEHRIGVQESSSASVVRLLRSALPGLGVERSTDTEADFRLVMDLRLNTRRRALRSDNTADVSSALLQALAATRGDEVIRLRWLLTDRLQPTAVSSTAAPLPSESLLSAVLRAPFGTPPNSDAEARSALRDKQSQHGFRVIGQIAVKAATGARAQQLAGGVLGALRQAEAPGVRIAARSVCSSQVNRLGGHGKLRLNVVELASVCAWPIGETANLPVVRLGSRRLPPASAIPSAGRVVGESTWPGRKRHVAVSVEDGLRHLHLLGPTGTGKSTLMLNLILQDIEAGRGCVVVDPKSDLVADVLARIPASRRHDVVVIDGKAGEHVVGINPLAGSGSPEVAADQLLEVFHRLYSANWGPRTNDILGAALHTIARVGGHSLVSVPLLLSDPRFRRRIAGQIDDPLGVGGFWAQYEAWSEAERLTAISPVLNKLRPFLMRPNLRHIVGQAKPAFDISDVFTRRRIVLIDLAKGQLGAEAAQLLGALTVTQLWQATLGRSAVVQNQRHPVNVYLDEFQDYLALPISLEDALTQARGLGVGFTLAHQHLKQLPPSLKSAVMANARSRVVFQTSDEDARELSHSSTLLGAEDFAGLDAFHFYARLMAAGQAQPWCSGMTRPAPRPTGDPAELRAAAMHRFGTPAGEVDEELRSLVGAQAKATVDGDADDLSPKRRGGRS